MTVLVVDQERKMAGLLRRGLIEAGFTVDLAESGEAAMAKAAAARYEAVVLEEELPGIGGIETCRRLRGDGFTAPVMVLSARGAIEDREGTIDAGADAYLLKPFSLDELVARLHRLVADRPGGSHPLLRTRL